MNLKNWSQIAPVGLRKALDKAGVCLFFKFDLRLFSRQSVKIYFQGWSYYGGQVENEAGDAYPKCVLAYLLSRDS